MLPIKHTPGPWFVTRHATPDHSPQFGIYDGYGRGRDIATIYGANAEADAALIAAAPALLAALEAMVNMEDWAGDDIAPDSTLGRALAAIAQARDA